jgi:hypothetical protein
MTTVLVAEHWRQQQAAERINGEVPSAEVIGKITLPAPAERISAIMLDGMLKRDRKALETGKISTDEFRKRWELHFASPAHMDVCDCYGICPFRSHHG